MTTAAIRKKLMAYIADADDKKVKGLYMLIEDEILYERKFKLTSDHVKLLDQERNKHITGKSKSYHWDDAKQMIRSKKKV